MDELLQWDEAQFGGIKSLALLPTMVWLPDFGIGNRFTMLEKLLDIQRDATGISATDDNLHLIIKSIPYL